MTDNRSDDARHPQRRSGPDRRHRDHGAERCTFRRGGRVLQGPHHLADHRLQRRQRLRHLRAPARTFHRQAHPRPAGGRRAEHAGRGQHQGGDVSARGGAERRQRHRHDRTQCPAGTAPGRRAIRRPQLHLARQHRQQFEPLRHLARDADPDLAGRADQAVRACGRRLRVGPRQLRAHPEERLRRQGQARHRLSRRYRDESGHRARRGRRSLRLVLGQHQEHATGLASRPQAQPPRRVLAAEGGGHPVRSR